MAEKDGRVLKRLEQIPLNPMPCPDNKINFSHNLSLTERLKIDVVVMLDVIIRLAATKYS